MNKVLMYPKLSSFDNTENGIKRVVEAYHKYLPNHGWDVVEDDSKGYDVSASHAGLYINTDVMFCHGIYWTADYLAQKWEWAVNKNLVKAIRHAKTVTVPSAWVQEVFQRDMRFSPTIVPHGIDVEEWKHDYDNHGYILWNKNRNFDVCSPEPVGILADKFKNQQFVSTFMPNGHHPNIKKTGIVNHKIMKQMVQKSHIYLSTTKETFGIGVLEALAAGVPVLGFAYGGNLEIVQHGVNGYLAKPGDYDDLARGLEYCHKYRNQLGANGIERAKEFTWDAACEIVADVLTETMVKEPPTVGVVIPAYNKADTLKRAVHHAIGQTKRPDAIVIIDDGSTDDTSKVGKELAMEHDIVYYYYQDNKGVAVARNHGAERLDAMKYLCFLDADDWIMPKFLETCVNALEANRSLHLAYTRLQWEKPDGTTGVSNWPDEWIYDRQLKRQNQVPTCNVMRNETFQRLGGYKSRYCPTGAGSEDAELWDRFGAYGYKAELVSTEPMFVYSMGSGHTAQAGYNEMDWLLYHPWAHDNKHPFASYATPRKVISHPVRQYDQPNISVIIPVGDGHESLVKDALDTVDGQSYRSWEAIVVWDSVQEIPNTTLKAYPHVRFINNEHSAGAGVARNIGAKHARGEFLLFLDADDWLYPDALDKMMAQWDRTGEIVYTDYVGKAQITKEYADKLGNRLLQYNDKDGEAVISYHSLDFDCEKAIREPNDIRRPYIWNLITSLVPKVWHDEIGGFDESMKSWEDWDYWIRMARSGKCFTRISEPLIVYRFYTGNRREQGAKIAQSLVKYLIQKYEETSAMACSCKDKKTPQSIKIVTSSARSAPTNMNDDEFVLIKYMNPNKGQHTVVGMQTGRKYGHRGGGEMFYVHIDDIKRSPNLFMPVERKPSAPQPEHIEEPLEPPKIGVVDEDIKVDTISDTNGNEFVITMIPGITSSIAGQLENLGLTDAQSIIDFGVDNLSTKVKGVGEVRAKAILSYLEGLE